MSLRFFFSSSFLRPSSSLSSLSLSSTNPPPKRYYSLQRKNEKEEEESDLLESFFEKIGERERERGLKLGESVHGNEFAVNMLSIFQDEKERDGRWLMNLPKLPVAVSGGPDSLSLSLLLKEWVLRFSEYSPVAPCLTALIVDHQMRPESTEEAKQVQEQLQSKGIEAHILPLNWKNKTQNLNNARNLRYEVLKNWCHAFESPVLFEGHQMNDQAEGVIFRMTRNSGINGLAGMPPLFYNQSLDLTICRPLLSYHKSRLIETCREREAEFVTDPSNSNPKTWRGKVREIYGEFQDSPELIAQLNRVAEICQDLKKARERGAERFIEEFVWKEERFGFVEIQLEPLIEKIEETVAIRVLTDLCGDVLGKEIRFESEKVYDVYSSLRSLKRDSSQGGMSRTLFHVLWKVDQKGKVLSLFRERERENKRVPLVVDRTGKKAAAEWAGHTVSVHFDEEERGEGGKRKRREFPRLFVRSMRREGENSASLKKTQKIPSQIPVEAIRGLPIVVDESDDIVGVGFFGEKRKNKRKGIIIGVEKK